jgi:hypothetical protein
VLGRGKAVEGLKAGNCGEQMAWHNLSAANSGGGGGQAVEGEHEEEDGCQNRKSEGRNPKEIRRPKSEWDK